jgi:hypothetical protein
LALCFLSFRGQDLDDDEEDANMQMSDIEPDSNEAADQSEPKMAPESDTPTVSRSSSSASASRAALRQPVNSRLDTLLESRPQPHKDVKQRNVSEIQEEMIEACMAIIKDENRGATHFVSSIDLGAKVFYTETVTEKKSFAKASAKVGVDSTESDGGASLGTSASNESTSRSLRSGTTATIHPRVTMQTIKTVVTQDQERVIGYEVSPVWLLVQDKDWRQAMKHACWHYVYDRTSKSPFPVISKGEI